MTVNEQTKPSQSLFMDILNLDQAQVRLTELINLGEDARVYSRLDALPVNTRCIQIPLSLHDVPDLLDSLGTTMSTET